MTTLIAKTRIKFGSKVTLRDRFGVVTTEPGTSVGPGEEFDAPDAIAKQVLADGAAVTPARFLEEAHAYATRGEVIPAEYAAVRSKAYVAVTPEEKLRAAVAEANAAGLNVEIAIAPDGGPAAERQRAAQERETAGVERATKARR